MFVDFDLILLIIRLIDVVLLLFMAFAFLAKYILRRINRQCFQKLPHCLQNITYSTNYYYIIIMLTVAALLLLHYPRFIADGYDTVSSVLLSGFYTIRTFSGTADFHSNIGLFLQKNGLTSFVFYGVLLYAVAIFLTLRAILQLLREFFSLLYFRMSFFKWNNLHVFSDLNQKSIILATSLYEQATFFHKPLILFASVDGEQGSLQQELLPRLKMLGAFRTQKSITDIKLPRRAKIYFLADDEDKSISDAIAIAHRQKSKRIKQSFDGCIARNKLTQNQIYAFSTLDSARLFVNMNNTNCSEENYAPITLVNEAKLVAFNLLFEHPLFAAVHRKGQLKAMIIGLGTYGLEIARTMLWCGQSLNTNFSLTMAEKDFNNMQQIKAYFEKDCKNACDLICQATRNTSFKKTTDITWEPAMNARTSDLETMLERHDDINYIVVCLGDDEDTYNTAVETRKFFMRKLLLNQTGSAVNDTAGFHNNPIIIAIIRGEANFELVEDSLKQNKTDLNYNIIPYGCNRNIFTGENILNWKIDIIARYFYLVYEQEKDNNINREKAEQKYYEANEIVKYSNWANALHVLYKLNDIGIKISWEDSTGNNTVMKSCASVSKEKADCGNVDSCDVLTSFGDWDVTDRIDELINNNINELAELEHLRWCIFYYLEGFNDCRTVLSTSAIESIIAGLYNQSDTDIQEKSDMQLEKAMFPFCIDDNEIDSKNYICKIHKCLVPFAVLASNYKKYDLDLVKATGRAFKDWNRNNREKVRLVQKND